MISGIALTASLLLAANPSPPFEVSAEAAGIVAGIRRAAPADTAYTELRFARMLREPLILHGELHYGGAERLGKRVDAPYRETTTIADGEVEVRREGKPARHFSLDRAPQIQGLLTSFTALLGGDVGALDRHFAIAAERSGSDWRLTLVPRARDLSEKFRDVVVDGRDGEPRCFTLHETDGDASAMLLGTLAAAPLPAKPTPAAIDALCRRGAP